MDFTTIIGVAASLLTSTSLIPQVIKIIREKKSEDISLLTLGALFVGHCLWIYYGILKNDPVIIASNGFACTVDMTTFVLGIKYRSN